MNRVCLVRVPPAVVRAFAGALALLLLLAGCGGDDGDDGAQIQWIEGTAPPEGLAQTTQPADAGPPTMAPTTAPTVGPAPTPTPPAPGAPLTAAQLEELRPNELGLIPVLEYHVFTTDADQEAQFTRTVTDFRSDLEWLYEHGFYVVPLRDVILNQIAAPAGKRPVVLTFDDSTAGQFRYLAGDDGALTIDPDSAVGVMEAFYAEHPDFGRGGFFAALPQGNFCFAWQGEEREEDQVPLCQQKIAFLLDNGYEIGNHTLDHQDLSKVDDETFLSQIGGAFEAFREYDPRATADILAMPFGAYPDLETRQQHRAWLRDGFTHNGTAYQLLGCLMVGANPAYSPNSTEWDPVFIARIQAFDEDAKVKDGDGNPADDLTYWFDLFEAEPERMYASDGNPATVTVPEALPPAIDGTLDEERIAAQGKELIRY